MRWLKRFVLGVVALLGLSVLGLFAYAHRPGSGHAEVTVQIARPPQVVYGYLTDQSKLKSWLGGLKELRPLGPRKERAVMDLGDGAVEEDLETIAAEENHLLRLRVTSTPQADFKFDEVIEYQLEPAGTGTRLRFVSDTRYGTVFAQLMEPLITPSVRTKIGADFGHLRQLVEAAP